MKSWRWWIHCGIRASPSYTSSTSYSRLIGLLHYITSTGIGCAQHASSIRAPECSIALEVGNASMITTPTVMYLGRSSTPQTISFILGSLRCNWLSTHSMSFLCGTTTWVCVYRRNLLNINIYIVGP